MADCQKRQVHHAGHLNKKTHARTHTHTDRKRDNRRTQNYKERKDSEITQYEITQYDCDTGVSNTINEFIPGHSGVDLS